MDSALAIIADLLDLARADSGGISVERVPAVLEHVAREAVDDPGPPLRQVGPRLLEVSVAEGVQTLRIQLD